LRKLLGRRESWKETLSSIVSFSLQLTHCDLENPTNNTISDAFVPGLSEMEKYLNTCTKTPSSFSGTHLLTLIDAFAPPLLTHLTDEIPSLLELARFGGQLPLMKIFEREGQKAARGQSKTGASSFFFRNLDCEFEAGRWRGWPAIPGPVVSAIYSSFLLVWDKKH